ncbi:uncharacterized protein PAE49_007703 [Odontesthes bonariensis]|uniref:uncharacterized protein LOC142384202 n=1 Tax=Odontesthes bonariensis TaxID=219752 RepID=UPI003F58EC6D
MAYQHSRRSIRDAYEEQFPSGDAREVTVHRIVNIVEKRSSMPRQGVEFERRFDDDQWYGGPRNYQDARGYHGEESYLPNERHFEEKPSFSSFRRNSSPPRNGVPYSSQYYGRDDLRHQLSSRSSSRAQHFRKRGRGSGAPQREDHEDYRASKSLVITRERSPVRRGAQPPPTARSGSNATSTSVSPDKDKGHPHQQTQQKHKPSVVSSHTPSSSVEESPHSSVSSKANSSASVAESEEAAAASMEPKQNPEEDLKTRRLEAIEAKALEIEKHYRQDCETFRTVVKMLVAKKPGLENLLQTSLDENLLEIQQHCLNALKSFITELDEILEQPETSP